MGNQLRQKDTEIASLNALINSLESDKSVLEREKNNFSVHREEWEKQKKELERRQLLEKEKELLKELSDIFFLYSEERRGISGEEKREKTRRMSDKIESMGVYETGVGLVFHDYPNISKEFLENFLSFLGHRGALGYI